MPTPIAPISGDLKPIAPIRPAGASVQQALQLRSARVPVVVISGDDSAGSRERALQFGAVAFLRKPVDAAVLIATVRDALERRA